VFIFCCKYKSQYICVTVLVTDHVPTVAYKTLVSALQFSCLDGPTWAPGPE